MAIVANRPPDESGPAGRGWLMRLSAADRAEWPAALDGWLLECPGFGIGWSAYAVHVIALRAFPHVPPAKLRTPDMTHELLVMSLDDQKHALDVDRVQSLWPAKLEPLNYIRQFAVPSDADACQLARSLVRAFLAGALPIEPHVFVPQADGSLATKMLGLELVDGKTITPASMVNGSIDATAACIRAGNHAPH